MGILRQYPLKIILIICLLLPVKAKAAGDIVLHEQEIKAGLLYNFLKYTEWPAEKMADSIEVCIFGADPFNGYLSPMKGRTVNQRTINIRNIYSVSDANKCHLLFVNKDEKAKWPELLNALAGKPVLTVSDFNNFDSSGGMIEFNLKNSHIGAELNMPALRAAHLRVEDRLLRLVSVVNNGP